MRRTLLGILALTGLAAAQPAPGNVVVLTVNGLLEVARSGAVRSLAALPAGERGMGLCPTLDDRGLLVLTSPRSSPGSRYTLLEWRGNWSTLTVIAPPPGPRLLMTHAGAVPEQQGDYIVATATGLFRVQGLGGTVTTLLTAGAAAVADYLTPGGWVILRSATLDQVTRAGQRSRLLSLAGPGPIPLNGGTDVFHDLVNGHFYVCYQGHLLQVDPVRRLAATLLPAGRGKNVTGTMDPTDRTLLVGQTNTLLRLDRQGRVLATVALLPATPVDLAVFGSNHLQGAGSARPGSAYPIGVSFQGHGGAWYQLAASFGYFPGITLGGVQIPLNPDPLFFLSFLLPSLFSQFGGPLSTSGQGAALLRIPPGPLSGVRFYLGGVAYDGSGIRAVAEPEGVTIR